MNTYMYYMHIHGRSVSIYNLHRCVYTQCGYMYIRMYTHKYIHIYICTTIMVYIHINIVMCICICIYIYRYVPARARAHVCTCTYISTRKLYTPDFEPFTHTGLPASVRSSTGGALLGAPAAQGTQSPRSWPPDSAAPAGCTWRLRSFDCHHHYPMAPM